MQSFQKCIDCSESWLLPALDTSLQLSKTQVMTCFQHHVLLSSSVSQPLQMCYTKIIYCGLCCVAGPKYLCLTDTEKNHCQFKADLISDSKEMKPVISVTQLSDLRFHDFSKNVVESIFVFYTVH